MVSKHKKENILITRADALNLKYDHTSYTLYGPFGGFNIIIDHAHSSTLHKGIIIIPLAHHDYKRRHGDFSFLKGVHHGIARASFNNNVLRIQLNRKINRLNNEQYHGLLTQIVTMLKTYGFQSVCSKCGMHEPTPQFYKVLGAIDVVCPPCFDYVVSTLDKETELIPQVKEKIGLGIVGATLGGIVGLASLFLLYRINIPTTFLGFIMSATVLNGYYMGAKALDKRGLYISGTLIFIMNVLAVILSWSIKTASFVDDASLLSILIQFPQQLFNGNVIIKDTLMEWLWMMGFSIVGALPTIDTVLKQPRPIDTTTTPL